MGDFTMPSLGADMDEGTVTEWRVKPGDEVHRGDIVAVVDTEKSTIEVEVFEDGVVSEIVVPQGEKVPVGTVLARIGEPGVAVPEPATVAVAPLEVAVPVGAPEPVPVLAGAPVPVDGAVPVTLSPVVRHLADHLGVDLRSVPGTGPGGSVTRSDVEQAAEPPPRPVMVSGATDRPRASPMARRLASSLGVELADLRGSGPDGAIHVRDVERAAPPNGPPTTARTPIPPPDPTPTVAAPASGAPARLQTMRRQTGVVMARSKREIPHYYLSTTIDLGRAVDWLAGVNTERAVAERLAVPALLIKATAVAATRVPEVNGFWVDEAFVASEAVHVGVAVSLRGGGLVAPAIRDAGQMSVDQLMWRLRDLVTRCRTGSLKSSEVSGATITVTNLGDLGVESVFGVIYPPQVALVGFGRVADRPVAKDGWLAVRPTLTATLSADHRVSDGHRGGRFLAEIDHLLQEPESL